MLRKYYQAFFSDIDTDMDSKKLMERIEINLSMIKTYIRACRLFTNWVRMTWLAVFMIALPNVNRAADEDPRYLQWGQLSALPDEVGFAGSFAGVSNGALLVGGGSNFPQGQTPWNGGAKLWYDDLFALEKPDGQWKRVGRLPRKLGYGVSATWRDGMVCVGGSNAEGHFAEAFIVRYQNGKITIEDLPSLPDPLANASGALLGNVLYVAGGIRTPDAKSALSDCWSIDLAAAPDNRQWRREANIPGPGRMLSVAGVQDGAFFVFSGVELVDGQRRYLTDAYRLSKTESWTRLSDLPASAAAAPTPAYAAGQGTLLIMGGDDGSLVHEAATLQSRHPGFSDQVWSYNVITDVWAAMESIPTDKKSDAEENPNGSTWPAVTTATVNWHGKFVIPGGEVRPATRTPRVLTAQPVQQKGVFLTLDWLVVIAYFLLTIAISIVVSRKMSGTTSEFFLGGSKIPWWAAGLSIFGTTLSALTFIAIPAKAYATDWAYLVNNLMIVVVAPCIVYLYLPYFRKLKITSVYEYLEIRFSRSVKLLGSVVFLIFQMSRLGVVIYLPALVVSSLMGIDLMYCIVVTSLVTTVYCFLGGIEAVVWTDVMQVVVLLGGALATLFYIAFSLDGGFIQLFDEASASHKLVLADLGSRISEPVLWVMIVGGFFGQLVTYSSDQVVVQRYLTTATEQKARKSIYTNALLTIPASILFFSVGSALWVYFRHKPGAIDPHGRIDDVFPWFIAHELPSGISGLVIAGVFAATMSTISSSMNSMATVITTDFYQNLNPKAQDKEQFRFARWTTVVLGIIGCLVSIYIASLGNTSIWDQYIAIIGLLGGCLAGMFMAGILVKRIHARAVLSGFIVSATALFVVKQFTSIHLLLYAAVGVLGCFIVSWLASLIIPSKAKDE